MNVEALEINGWEELQRGLVIAEDDKWILVKHIPVDFVIDGYRIYKKEYITNRYSGSNERLIERVLMLKGESTVLPDNFKFADTAGFLQWSQEKFGLFEFQDDDETELFYGQINRIFNSSLIINSIYSDGTVDKNFEFEFKLNDIRTIGFQSDYFNAIRLLWMDENKL